MSESIQDELRALVSEFRNSLALHHENGRHEWPVESFVKEEIEVSEAVQSGRLELMPPVDKEAMILDLVRQDLGDCKRCALHQNRQHIVFGSGNENADLLFIGDAPGADEDSQGVPFVGEAGQLLDKMIVAMGFKRQDVYVANVLKCHTPEGRVPKEDEISECKRFLEEQIQTIKPKVIVTLGLSAAQVLLQTKAPLDVLRGNWNKFLSSDVMPTFHPSSLLKDPRMKKDTWSDLQAVMAKLA